MKRLFLCLLALWVFACDNTLGTPSGIISEKKMVSILTELQVAESKVKNLRVSSDSARHIFSIYELKILNTHNVTPEEYLRSYEYYLENHRLMMRVHQAVLDTLMARQTKVEKMPDIPAETLPVLPKDSIPKDSLLQKELPAVDSVEQNKALADSVRKKVRLKPVRRRDSKPELQRKDQDN